MIDNTFTKLNNRLLALIHWHASISLFYSYFGTVLIFLIFNLNGEWILSVQKTTEPEEVKPETTGHTTPHPSDVLDMPVDPNEPTYCVCQQVSYGEMIGCDNTEVSNCAIYGSDLISIWLIVSIDFNCSAQSNGSTSLALDWQQSRKANGSARSVHKIAKRNKYGTECSLFLTIHHSRLHMASNLTILQMKQKHKIHKSSFT